MFNKKTKDTTFYTKKQSTKQVGDFAEQAALDFLINKGLQRKFACPMGECDLIMKEREIIVFVEVRYKKSAQFCTPEETIHASKQRRLIKTAEYLLARYPNSDCRLDVVSISGNQPKLNITWIPNAFGVE